MCYFELDEAKVKATGGIAYCAVQSVRKSDVEKEFQSSLSLKRKKTSTALGRTCQKLLLMEANRNIQAVAFTFFFFPGASKTVFKYESAQTVFVSCSSGTAGTRESPGVYPDSQVGFTTSDVLCASILPAIPV